MWGEWMNEFEEMELEDKIFRISHPVLAKLEVREYVRLRNGIINKIDFIRNEYIYLSNGLICNKFNIEKHSKKIIDLIKKGDYVNNMLVINIVSISNSDFHEKFVLVNRDENCPLQPLKIYEENIQDILTKEQYEQNCYKVKKDM